MACYDSDLMTMSEQNHPDLDLARTIRPGLDILANEIVIALKKRSRFLVNAPVYEPGLVIGHPERTLLDYELTVCERNHAELGRYAFASQDAFTDISMVKSVIAREKPNSPIKVMPSGVGDKVLAFYRLWVENACRSGDDSSTYGETVTTDVLALLAIMERVNLGKAVAESKFLEMTDNFLATNGDREQMLQYIVRRDREEQVLEIAARLAENYDLPTEHTVDMFKFMIKTTVDIEVDYLKLRIAETNAGH